MSGTHLPPFWRQRLLAVLGAPRRPENLRLLDAWTRAEGGNARWNPLNTTWALPGATDYNAVGVKNYPRATWGILATALSLTSPASGTLAYGGILGDLQVGVKTAEQIVTDRADQFRTWGTSSDLILELLKEAP